jgi:hypothetical protein
MTSNEPADLTRLLADFTELDDTALLARRAEMRAELDRLPPLSAEHVALTRVYTATTAEVTDRARRAWTQEASEGKHR